MQIKLLTTLAPILVLALLASCRDEQGEGPMKPGIYSVITADRSHNRAIFKKDGTFVDMEDHNPRPVGEGKWWREDGKLCMQNTGAEELMCAEEKAAGDDGSFTLSANGITMEFKAVGN